VGVKGKLLEEAIDFAVKATTKKAERKSVAAAAKKAVKAAPKAASKVEAPAIVKSVSGGPRRASAGAAFDRDRLKTEYPEIAPPEMKLDKAKGTYYPGKSTETPELRAIGEARRAAQADINEGNYTPFFDPKERYYVDPADYPLEGRTLTDVLPAMPKTIANYREQANSPEALNKLRQAYAVGLENPGNADWYAVGQHEKGYRDLFGPEEGRRRFSDEYTHALAATTAGASPEQNMLIAHYGNVLRDRGQRLPLVSNEVPYPVAGGRYGVTGNLAMHNKVAENGISVNNPKRFNFAANFKGHRDRLTLDEQMMSAYGLKLPPDNAYGIFEEAIAPLAKEAGVPEANWQDVTWGGLKQLKDNKVAYRPKSKIEIINEALERTSRLTGLSPEDVYYMNLLGLKGPVFKRGGRVDAAALAQKYA